MTYDAYTDAVALLRACPTLSGWTWGVYTLGNDTDKFGSIDTNAAKSSTYIGGTCGPMRVEIRRCFGLGRESLWTDRVRSGSDTFGDADAVTIANRLARSAVRGAVARIVALQQEINTIEAALGSCGTSGEE